MLVTTRERCQGHGAAIRSWWAWRILAEFRSWFPPRLSERIPYNSFMEFTRPLPLLAALLACLVLLACSSGGDHIVFVSEVDGDPEIHAVDPRSGEIRALTSNGAGDYAPVWSPSRRLVAYESNESGDLEINFVDKDGKEVTRVTHTDGDDRTPRWSPEGEQLAIVGSHDGNGEVYVITMENGWAERATEDPSEDRLGNWSPDGEWLAFYRDGGPSGQDEKSGIWLRNPAGVNLLQLTTGLDSGPVWSPDGEHIAFVREDGGNLDIYLLSLSEGGTWRDDVQLFRLTQHESADHSPAWSPEDDLIAFVSERDGMAEIYVMGSDGSQQTRLTTNEAPDFSPVWSPDGNHMAFVSRLYGPGEIFVMRVDGTEQRRLTTNDAEDYAPDW